MEYSHWLEGFTFVTKKAWVTVEPIKHHDALVCLSCFYPNPIDAIEPYKQFKIKLEAIQDEFKFKASLNSAKIKLQEVIEDLKANAPIEDGISESDASMLLSAILNIEEAIENLDIIDHDHDTL